MSAASYTLAASLYFPCTNSASAFFVCFAQATLSLFDAPGICAVRFATSSRSCLMNSCCTRCTRSSIPCCIILGLTNASNISMAASPKP